MQPGIFYLIPLALAVYYLCVRFFLQAKPSETMVVRYGPPANLSPAAVRYLFTLNCDGRTYAAILAQLAAAQLVSISPDRKTGAVQLIKLDGNRDLLKQLPAEAGIVFKDLFEWQDTADLKTPEPDLLRKLQRSLQKQLDQYVTWGLWFIGIAILVSAAATIWMCLYSQLFGDDAFEAGVMSAFTGLTVAVFSAATAYVWSKNLEAASLALKGLYRRRVLFFLLPLILLYPAMWYLLIHTATPIFANVTGLLIVVNMLAAPLLRGHTSAGRRMMNEIFGFRQFLEHAEQDRLQRLNPPGQAAQAGQNLLPYAIALDLREDWGDQLGIKAMVETAL